VQRGSVVVLQACEFITALWRLLSPLLARNLWLGGQIEKKNSMPRSDSGVETEPQLRLASTSHDRSLTMSCIAAL
jgi:hypothetical protein